MQSRSLLLVVCVGTVLLETVGLSQVAKLDSSERKVLQELRVKLGDAQNREDEAEVVRLAGLGVKALGDQAGLPEAADQYIMPPAETRPLTAAEALDGFSRIEKFVSSNQWWRRGLDPSRTEHLAREVGSVINGCLAGARANAPNKAALLRLAKDAGDYLLWTQQQAGSGVIPFPALRGGRSTAFESADRALRQAERAGKSDQMIRQGWVVEDNGDGGLQFDNGICGVALLDLHESVGEPGFLEAGLAAADWALKRPVVPNWNYNSFSMELLARTYRARKDPRYLEAAKRKFRLGVAPGQLNQGPREGRWADPHNARPAYHYIMVRGMAALLRVLPASDPDYPLVISCCQRALKSRNREFSTKGVMNKDSSLEALLEVEALPAEIKAALGFTGSAQAIAVLERLVAAELRRGRESLSPGVAGRFFASVLGPQP